MSPGVGRPGKVSIRISNEEPCRDLRVWDGRGKLLCGKDTGNRAGSPGVAGRGKYLLVDRRVTRAWMPAWLGGESYLHVKDRVTVSISPGVGWPGERCLKALCAPCFTLCYFAIRL